MRYILILVTLFFVNIAYSQDTTGIRDNLKHNKDVIQNIEKRFHIKFFYNDEWLDDIELKENFNQDLKITLVELFKNTNIKYYQYQDEYVILTKGEELIKEKKQEIQEYDDIEILYGVDGNDKVKEKLKNEEKKIIVIGSPGGSLKRVVLSGNVSEIFSGQNIPGVAVYIDDGNVGTTTDKNGNYALVMDKGYHVVYYKHLAMEPTKRLVEIYSGGKINVKLMQKNTELEEVMILGEDEKKERSVVGFEMLKTKELEELPTLLGEVDIIKQSLLLPGIQSVGEADMSFSVRGGKGDQNLVLIEGMNTYSYSHFFGFFPNINPNTLNKVNLYKASMPIQYGNRISSVYDVSLKSGDYKKISIDGGVSPVTANVAVSGPILKDKLTFSISGRSTYSDYIFNKIDLDEFNGSAASFYDYQAKMNLKLGSKSSLSLFYYDSYDDFNLHKDFLFRFYNKIGSLNWKYLFNDKTSISTIIGYTSFKSTIDDSSTEDMEFKKTQTISDFKINTSMSRELNVENSIKAGVEVVYQKLSPWSLNKLNANSNIEPVKINEQKALTNSLFIEDNYDYSSNLSFNIGIRYVTFFLLGEYDKYIYKDDQLLERYVIDTVQYANNELAHFNQGLDIRLSASYNLGYNHKLNLSFSRNNQFIHLMTNSQGVTPNDSWQLSNEYIKPQIGNQISLAYNVDFLKNKYFISLDFYYKKTKNNKDFIDGSEFEFNSHPETEIVEGEGKSYGIELLLKKNLGRLSGFVSYTYSRSFIKSGSKLEEKNVNNGEFYPASNDKPHNLSAVLNFKPTRRLTLSNVFNFSSGAPITIPIAKLYLGESYSIIYSDRNEYRMPNYFRWDASLTFKGSLKKKRFKSIWTLSVINITGRKNPYSIFYKTDRDNIQGYQLSIIGEPIPTLTYKFSF